MGFGRTTCRNGVVRCLAGDFIAEKGARDGKLVLPALGEDAFCFAPLVLLDEATGPVPARPERLGKSETPLLGPIEIAVGQVTIRLDGATTATRIAEIVRAIGASS